MGSAFGDLLPLAVGVAISPISIIAVILMLISPRAKSNGLTFLTGWVIGLGLVGTALVVIGDTVGLSTSDGPAKGASVVRLLLGPLLLVAAARRWRHRPAAGVEAPMPRWMTGVEKLGDGRALVMGMTLSGLNPKNLALNISAAATIAQSGASGGDQAVLLLAFVLIASLGIATPVGVYVAMGHRAGRVLGGWKRWLVVNDATVTSVVLLVFGFGLLGKGIAGLA